ncbi:MAG: hypothetical protein IT579_24140 [Verrucomicrobia subdivision 3 bacterium]|nr:hypothetical protein [Limisphaerales bacterium]
MKKRSRQGLRRFTVEVRSWGNYVERIADLERTLAKKPRTLQIEIIGTDEIPADVALRFRTALMKRSPRTGIVTNAHSSLQGGSVLLWLLGDSRTIRDDARLYFRRTTWSEEDEVEENGGPDEPVYRDSYSAIDPDEGDYARVLQLINEFLPVKEMAGRLIGALVLRQFGLIENEKVDDFLATVFSKSSELTESSMNATTRLRVRKSERPRARQLRK